MLIVLLCLSGCSTEKRRQVVVFKSLDHHEVWKQLDAFRTSEDWPDEKKFEKLTENREATDLLVPSQIADLDPWGVLVFPEGPPRVEFAFWVPSETLKRDTIALTYVFDGGEIPEGIRHEDANLGGTEISVTVKIEKIAESTYLTTSE